MFELIIIRFENLGPSIILKSIVYMYDLGNKTKELRQCNVYPE